MASKLKTNHLFISASMSLILVAFFIIVESNKSDVPPITEKPQIKREGDTQCKDIISSGLTLMIEDTEVSKQALLGESPRLEEIINTESLRSLKLASNCLSRAPINVSIDKYLQTNQIGNNIDQTLTLINKVSEAFSHSFKSSILNRDLNINVISTLNLHEDIITHAE